MQNMEQMSHNGLGMTSGSAFCPPAPKGFSQKCKNCGSINVNTVTIRTGCFCGIQQRETDPPLTLSGVAKFALPTPLERYSSHSLNKHRRKAQPMNESIFRQKSLDRISSPEEIDNYIRVTRPSLWLALGVIILLLAALILWSVTARIEATMVVDGQTVTEQIAPVSFLIG